MGRYRVTEIHPSVEKFLRKHHELRGEFQEHLERICEGPFPENRPGTIGHLRGPYLCLHKYRIGDIRLIYDVDNDNQLIKLVDLGPRSSIYDKK